MRTLQFRCPLCKRLLIKWEEGSKEVIYSSAELDSHGKTRCSKCNLALVFKDHEFVVDTDTKAIPCQDGRPAKI